VLKRLFLPAVAAGLIASAAPASASIATGNVDLATAPALRLVGPADHSAAGRDVTVVGDINGDGRRDVAIGDSSAGAHGPWTGAVSVVFGTAVDALGHSTTDLGTLPGAGQGVRIDGSASGDFLQSVADAGDVNGDGHPDLLVAAPTGGSAGQGVAWVIYGWGPGGGPAGGVIDLATLTSTQGRRFDGPTSGGPSAGFGSSLAGLGDIDGDGRADIAVAAPIDETAGSQTGTVFVLHGWSGAPADVDLDGGLPAAADFRITGGNNQRIAAVGGGGPADLDGDGHPDVVVSTNGVNGGGYETRVVVLWSDLFTGADISLPAAAQGSFEQISSLADTGLGFEGRLFGTGDLDGDGRTDLVVGAPRQASFAGDAYVFWGRPRATSTSFAIDTMPADRGYRLDGKADSFAGFAVAVRDIDGDGRPDIALGAPKARQSQGDVVVVYGTAGRPAAPVSLTSLPPSAGYTVHGSIAAGIFALGGLGVTLDAGNVTGDGRSELFVGEPSPETGPGSVWMLAEDLPLVTTPVPPASQAPKALTPPPPVVPLPLRCSRRSIVLLGVSPSRGGRVRIDGLALPRYAGRRVTVSSGGRTVGSATVAADGTFTTAVPAPPRQRRARARFQASVAGRHSAALRLERFMRILSERTGPRGTRLRARVERGTHRTAVISRQLGCGRTKRVATVKVGRDGTFTATLPRPAGRGTIAFYRASTRLHKGRTYTLPVVVRATPGG
jgi:hypothetical protein